MNFLQKSFRTLCCSIALSALCLVASGCGPRRAFTGPELPESQVALIKGSWFFYGIASQEVGIQEVDGMELSGYSMGAPSEVQVLPGAHAAKVRYRTEGGNRITWTDYPFPINVKAGGVYKLEFENYDGETYIWMNEEPGMTLVAGQRPPK